MLLVIVLGLSSCAEVRIHEKDSIGKVFDKYGVKDGCFMMRDHTHEEIFFFNKERCVTRYTPASTFKIFNSLVALETAIAPDDRYMIPWDSVVRFRPEWNRDMDLREALG